MDSDTDIYRNAREAVKKHFAAYAGKYDMSDPKIALKAAHTYRVAQLCSDIAESLDMSREDIFIIWLCGMLHDYGRFEQVKRYGTFVDSVSVDHAEFGADLLFKEGACEGFEAACEYAGNGRDDGGKNDCPDAAGLIRRSAGTVEKVIRVHNKFRVDPSVTGKDRIFADILRDADKIDILRVNCETPIEDIYNVSTEELRTSPVSADVKEAFEERRCAVRRPESTVADHVAGHVLLYFELVYPISRRIALDQGYLYRILDFESDNPETAAWFKYMKENI